jgi:hypothetical protein
MEGPARSSRAQRVLDAVQRSRVAEAAFRAGYDGPGDAVEVLRRWLADPRPPTGEDPDVAERERAGLLRGFEALADEARRRSTAHAWEGALRTVRAPAPPPSPPPPPASAPRAPRRRPSTLAAMLGAAASIAVTGAVLGIVAQSTGDTHPIASGVTPTPGWAQIDIASPWGPASGPETWFDADQTAADALADPSILSRSGSGVDEGSLRLIAQDVAGWDFRLGRTPGDDVCLIATTAVQASAVSPGAAGIHCVAPAEAGSGIVLSYLPTDSGAISARWDGTTLRLRRTGTAG